MLHCSPEEFITVVDIMAKENQGYYTACWLPESMEPISDSIRVFLTKKPSLDAKIETAAEQKIMDAGSAIAKFDLMR